MIHLPQSERFRKIEGKLRKVYKSLHFKNCKPKLWDAETSSA